MTQRPAPAPSTAAITAIDLFAGAGGFSVAARTLGIQVLAAVDSDRHACRTYEANIVDQARDRRPLLIRADVNELEPRMLMERVGLAVSECDILLGGPPCQGYSAHRFKDAGVNDPRNKLLLRYFDFVEAIKPATFVVENVAGLLWPRHAKYLSGFLELAAACGYDVVGPTALNARDYGVPQNRRRVFIVGCRRDVGLAPEWPPEPTRYPPNSREVLAEGRPPWPNASVVFQVPLDADDPNAIHMSHNADLVRAFESTPPNGGSRSQSSRTLACHAAHDGHSDVYGRIDPSRPGPTMTTACVNPSKGRFLHPTENHGICVRHAARFQGFPDDFVFHGGLMAAAVQIGNAVPIPLGVAVLAPVVHCLLAARGSSAPPAPAAARTGGGGTTVRA